MKQIIIILFLIITGNSGYSQNDSIFMKKFSLEDYKHFILDKNLSYSTNGIGGTYRNGDESLKVIVSQENIIIYKGNDNNQYETLEYYSANNNQLTYSGQLFDRVEYGTWRKYDEQGNLIEEVDHDVHFDFSIEALIEKMLKEHGEDITNKALVSVRRYYKEEYDISFYSVVVRPFAGASQHYGYIIDGNTGKTLLHDGRSRGDGLESVLNTFLKTLKN